MNSTLGRPGILPRIVLGSLTIKHKENLSDEKVIFGKDQVTGIDSTEELLDVLPQEFWINDNLLVMSSGNFRGVDLKNCYSSYKLKLLSPLQIVSNSNTIS